MPRRGFGRAAPLGAAAVTGSQGSWVLTGVSRSKFKVDGDGAERPGNETSLRSAPRQRCCCCLNYRPWSGSPTTGPEHFITRSATRLDCHARVGALEVDLHCCAKLAWVANVPLDLSPASGNAALCFYALYEDK